MYVLRYVIYIHESQQTSRRLMYQKLSLTFHKLKDEKFDIEKAKAILSTEYDATPLIKIHQK